MRLNESLKEPGVTETENNGNGIIYLKFQLCNMY